MRKFKDLQVWQLGFEIMIETYQVVKEMPREERFGLSDQIRRASVSIPSNIAEGCSRSSELEFKRFLEISMGSAFELETQLMAIKELNLTQLDFSELQAKIDVLQRKLNAIISSVKARSTRK